MALWFQPVTAGDHNLNNPYRVQVFFIQDIDQEEITLYGRYMVRLDIIEELMIFELDCEE